MNQWPRSLRTWGRRRAGRSGSRESLKSLKGRQNPQLCAAERPSLPCPGPRLEVRSLERAGQRVSGGRTAVRWRGDSTLKADWATPSTQKTRRLSSGDRLEVQEERPEDASIKGPQRNSPARPSSAGPRRGSSCHVTPKPQTFPTAPRAPALTCESTATIVRDQSQLTGKTNES